MQNKTPCDFNADLLAKQFPILIPALIHLGHIAPADAMPLLKRTILTCPALYKHLNEVEKSDKYLIIATLAQDSSFEIISHIKQAKLEPGFVRALCDVWPEIDPQDLVSEYGQDGNTNPLPGFEMFRNILLLALLAIMLTVIAYYFWPIIALWPEAVLTCMAGLLFVLDLSALCITVPTSYLYLTKVYPETKNIRKTLTESSFFKTAASIERSSTFGGLNDETYPDNPANKIES